MWTVAQISVENHKYTDFCIFYFNMFGKWTANSNKFICCLLCSSSQVYALWFGFFWILCLLRKSNFKKWRNYQKFLLQILNSNSGFTQLKYFLKMPNLIFGSWSIILFDILTFFFITTQMENSTWYNQNSALFMSNNCSTIK